MSGSVVEFSPATRETGVRFPAHAFIPYFAAWVAWRLELKQCLFTVSYAGLLLRCCHLKTMKAIYKSSAVLQEDPLRVGFEPTRENPI